MWTYELQISIHSAKTLSYVKYWEFKINPSPFKFLNLLSMFSIGKQIKIMSFQKPACAVNFPIRKKSKYFAKPKHSRSV